ncbi:hypothetical protein [Yoonia litorea]|uniref:Glycosyl transferase family 2 n=1 Tax=Yoonia litorea TaxID=1123755 RepID=A0A1I6MV74_9RHOB|nr:hypothetical protein [Yoonia litorea]SFS19549.1 hypothetical protein SAMN05444714_2236 [Yoonia litorea]
MPSFTVFFTFDSAERLYTACHLAASVRTHLPPDVTLIGYCPAGALNQMGKDLREVMRRLGCKLQELPEAVNFVPNYPDGLKITASVAPKETDFSMYLDTNTVFLRQRAIEELVSEAQIGVVPAEDQGWTDQTIWTDIYGVFDLAVPDEDLAATKTAASNAGPFLDTGVIVIDETYRTADGKRFADVWMETAQTIDRHSFIPHKRPHLDQMSLPVAIARAGMTWKHFNDRFRLTIDGKTKHRNLPKPVLLHYQNREVLGADGRKKDLDEMLKKQIGTHLVRRVFDVPEHRSLPLRINPKGEVQPKTAAGIQVPDPSKAQIALVTVAREADEALGRWYRYYVRLFGDRSLYILCPDNAKDIAVRCGDANIIPLPQQIDEQAVLSAAGSFASGLTLYFNWVAFIGIDEFLIVDPLTASDLSHYLSDLAASGRVPKISAPLGFELVNSPTERPVFARVSSNVQKPCMTRGRIDFDEDGKACSNRSFAVDPQICLVKMTDNAEAEGVDASPLIDMELKEVRRALIESKSPAGSGFWRIAPINDPKVYRLPARISDMLAAIASPEGTP